MTPNNSITLMINGKERIIDLSNIIDLNISIQGNVLNTHMTEKQTHTYHLDTLYNSIPPIKNRTPTNPRLAAANISEIEEAYYRWLDYTQRDDEQTIIEELAKQFDETETYTQKWFRTIRLLKNQVPIDPNTESRLKNILGEME